MNTSAFLSDISTCALLSDTCAFLGGTCALLSDTRAFLGDTCALLSEQRCLSQ